MELSNAEVRARDFSSAPRNTLQVWAGELGKGQSHTQVTSQEARKSLKCPRPPYFYSDFLSSFISFRCLHLGKFTGTLKVLKIRPLLSIIHNLLGPWSMQCPSLDLSAVLTLAHRKESLPAQRSHFLQVSCGGWAPTIFVASVNHEPGIKDLLLFSPAFLQIGLIFSALIMQTAD